MYNADALVPDIQPFQYGANKEGVNDGNWLTTRIPTKIIR